jgi:serine/threonine protein kinase
MLFWITFFIQEVFSMLKMTAEPKPRTPTRTQKATTKTAETQLVRKSVLSLNHEDRRPTLEEAAKQQDELSSIDKVRVDTVQQDRLPEQQTNNTKSLVKHNQKDYPSKIPVVPKKTTFYEVFHEVWVQQELLGEGGDGAVYLYRKRKESRKCIAVKLPSSNSPLARDTLLREIKNLRIIGRHDHILEMGHASLDWQPHGPAIFLPLCDLGDLISYREFWCGQQALKGEPQRVSEITMWKLFRDMALALHHLHNELDVRYVHNDFKPANILVATPPTHTGNTLPEEPVFKLADFARLTPWPTPAGQSMRGFRGTPEYAPPKVEQLAPVHNSVDIWGLGATLQYMALGINPTQSRTAFIRSRQAQGKSYPELDEQEKWTSEYWRRQVPTVFRPIHVPLAKLRKQHDLMFSVPDYEPYGAQLGYYYAQLWKPVACRPKASKLAALAKSYMEGEIQLLKEARQTGKLSGVVGS